MLASCSKSSSTFSIVCVGSGSDEAYTFNLNTGNVEVSRSLNKIGSKVKIAMFKAFDAQLESGEISKDQYDIQYDAAEKVFSEENKKMVITR